MTGLNAFALIITLAAIFSYINYRFISLPNSIGIMLIGLLLSLGMIAVNLAGYTGMSQQARAIVDEIDFNTTLMHGMLSFLLFAGALHVNLNDLARQKSVISLLATVGVVMSTFLIGSAAWLVFGWLDLNISYLYCLVFGALISPTDPIAVLGILKQVGAPKSLETKITGESLFNDGVGVVVFIVLMGIAGGTSDPTATDILILFLEEAVGGIIFGIGIGFIAYRMLRSIDNYQVEILITLAVVMGGYSLATLLHTSGPIAMVVAGLILGNHGRMFAMSDKTRDHLDTFWELVDEILNAVLFVLLGLEILLLTFTGKTLLAGLLLIPVTLAARFISVGIPISMLRLRREFSPNVVKILTWGGLRGGISVALALSIPEGPARDLLLAVTYVIVIFSIVVQGLTINRLLPQPGGQGASSPH